MSNTRNAFRVDEATARLFMETVCNAAARRVARFGETPETAFERAFEDATAEVARRVTDRMFPT